MNRKKLTQEIKKYLAEYYSVNKNDPSIDEIANHFYSLAINDVKKEIEIKKSANEYELNEDYYLGYKYAFEDLEYSIDKLNS